VLNLQIFGYSITNSMYKREKYEAKDITPKTFVDLLHEHYQTESSPWLRGIPQCSEERILYNLKKTKDIDVAVIFHSDPKFYLVFPDQRDHDLKSDKDLDDFMARSVNPDDTYGLFNLEERYKDKNIFNLNVTAYPGEFVKQLIKFQQSYLQSPDIMKNRYYGALIQIDQYCTYKKIPVIHCVRRDSIPSWFSFTSGIVDWELQEYQYIDPKFPDYQYSIGYHKSVNSINEEGNIIIANTLKSYIDQLLQS